MVRLRLAERYDGLARASCARSGRGRRDRRVEVGLGDELFSASCRASEVLLGLAAGRSTRSNVGARAPERGLVLGDLGDVAPRVDEGDDLALLDRVVEVLEEPSTVPETWVPTWTRRKG